MNLLNKSEKNFNKYKKLADNRFYHTKYRIKERYGLDIDVYDYYTMVDHILCGKAILLQKTKYVDFYIVFYKNCNILVVYEPESMSIKTALTMEKYK